MAGERLILTGFMGAGKSTVGPRVAEKLGVNYYDTDEWMETVGGICIPDLVRTNMPRFRSIEATTLGAILCQEPGVISTGGGIVSTEVGRRALLAAGIPVIWLSVPFEVTARRVAQDIGRERPLFEDISTARSLYEERAVWYKQTASHTVDAAQSQELVEGDVVKIARAA